MKTSIEFNLKIVFGEQMIEFEEKLCTLLEEKHRLSDLTSLSFIKAMAKKLQFI